MAGRRAIAANVVPLPLLSEIKSRAGAVLVGAIPKAELPDHASVLTVVSPQPDRNHTRAPLRTAGARGALHESLLPPAGGVLCLFRVTIAVPPGSAACALCVPKRRDSFRR